MTWIIVANSSCCRILTLDRKLKKLHVVKEMLHPESRLKGEDLVSDRPGHYKTSGPSHGAYEPHETPHQQEVHNFAKEIAHELSAAKNLQQYDGLILVAPSHLLGALHQSLDANIKACIHKEIHKDLNKLSPHELFLALEDEI